MPSPVEMSSVRGCYVFFRFFFAGTRGGCSSRRNLFHALFLFLADCLFHFLSNIVGPFSGSFLTLLEGSKTR